MSGYAAIVAARRQLFDVLEEALTAIGRRRYAQQSVPRRLCTYLAHWIDRPVRVTVTTERVTFAYHPYRETVSEVRFDGNTIVPHEPDTDDVALLREYPQALAGIAPAVADAWEATFDLGCPYTERLAQARQALSDAIGETRTTATLDDLVRAIRTGHTPLIELLFDVDRPLADQEGTELAALVEQPIETVCYRDDDLALLLPEDDLAARGRARNRSVWSLWPGPREAYVVGRDDTPAGFFVHAVDGANLTATTDVTRDMIRDAMGYDRDADPDATVLDPAENECVRVQGDLCLERTHTPATLRDAVRDRVRPEIERDVTAAFVDRYLRRCGLAAYREHLQLSGHGPDLAVTLREGPDAEAAAEAIATSCLARRRGPTQSRPDPDSQQRAIQLLERRLRADLRASRDEYREAVRSRMTRRVDEALRDCGQLNLPIDNHLLVLGNARLLPGEDGEREPVRIAVPERTSLHIVHDEHPQVDVHLRPGGYTVRLLARGIQPPADRPDW